MKNILLFCAFLFTAATFTSCIEEDPGLNGMESVQELNLHEALYNGTGLPRGLEMISVEYQSKTGETQLESLPHVVILFDQCADEWCKATTDDCGATAEVAFSFKEETGNSTLSFDALTNSPTLNEWAARQVFEFERERLDVTLSCTECLGTTRDGFEYTNRTVKLKAVR